MRPAKPIIERFWSQVRKTDWCWTVHGYRYGKIKTGPPEKRTISAHRFSWELHFGPVPAGKCVCHACNNKLCVRPDHLYLGTCKQNIHDAIRDGLKPDWSGDKNPKSKLGVELSKLIAMSPKPVKVLAEYYGVWETTIYRIRRKYASS